RRSLRLIGNLILMVILFAILFTFAMFQGGFVSWFLFFSFLPIFLYHLGLLLYPMKRWHVTRRLSDNNVRAGGKVSVTIQITRKIPFPLYYCIVEEIFPDSLMDIYYHININTYMKRKYQHLRDDLRKFYLVSLNDTSRFLMNLIDCHAAIIHG